MQPSLYLGKGWSSWAVRTLERKLFAEECGMLASGGGDFPLQRSEGKNKCTVYVGNLSWDIEEEQLEAALEAAGCKVKAIRWGEDKATGEFRGWGHVDLEDDASVVQAVALNGTELLGRPMRVSFAVERAPRLPPAARQAPRKKPETKKLKVAAAPKAEAATAAHA
jgi:RNA recognition motif-containing protein